MHSKEKVGYNVFFKSTMTQSDSTVSYNTIQSLIETNQVIRKGIHITCKCSQNQFVEPFTMTLSPDSDIKGIACKYNNNGQYILSTKGQILKYNHGSKKWDQIILTDTITKQLINYNQNICSFISTRAAMCISNDNLLFHNGHYLCQLSNVASPQQQEFVCHQNNQLGDHRYMVSVGKTIYVITNDPDDPHKWFHLKWSSFSQNYIILCQLRDSDIVLDVIQHQQKLWIIGRTSKNQDGQNIHIQEFNIDSNEWKTVYQYTENIYDALSNKFSTSISTVSIYNGQYLFIFGDDSWSDSIYIYDTLSNKLALSPYSLPNCCMRLCVSKVIKAEENQTIVDGFNREMNNQMSLIVPLHITKFLTLWFSREYIQLTCNRNNIVSWIINVDLLLP